MIGALIAREVRRGLHGSAWLPVAFFLLVATIVPFAVGPDARLLARIGGGALWIAALTAALLPIERLIEPDGADGSAPLDREDRDREDRRPLADLRPPAPYRSHTRELSRRPG